MSIVRNKINDCKDSQIVYQFLNEFEAVKCLFCFQDDKKFLCQCKECNKYFCNNLHRNTSHIIIHLNKCKHKKISLYPFELELKCANCPQKKDIFNLYYEKGNKNNILCEECIEDDKDNYIKIVEEKQIDNEILLSPDLPPLFNMIDSYTESLITRMNNKINLLKNLFLPTVSLNYTKKKRYCLIYNTLIQNEIDEIEKENKEDEFIKFGLKFDIIDKKYIVPEIKRSNQNFFFYPRQLLLIAKETNENKTFLASVINIDKLSNKVTIYFKDLDKLLNNENYLIKEKESVSNYRRIIDGLDEFNQKKSNLFNKNIQLLILGKEVKEEKEEKEEKGEIEEKDHFSNENEYIDKSDIPTRLNIHEFENVKLNPSQEAAIRNCFKNKFTIIKGPPGTGKSTVLSILAYHLIKLKKKKDKILICAPSNRAVDNISLLLQKIKSIKFVRVLSLSKEIIEDIDLTNSLNELIQNCVEIDDKSGKKNKKLKDLMKKRKEFGALKGDDLTEYNKLISEYEKKILDSCDIVLSTFNNSADSRIKNYEFPIVIMDEATQDLEPDSLLPLYHKAQMVVIIGDEKQLGPTVISSNSSITGISISLFERLCYYYNGSNFISILDEQYRMHEFLYRFSNEHFYNNQMKTNIQIKLDEKVMNEFPWPKKDIPSFFYHYIEPEGFENPSFYNIKEISLIFGMVNRLVKAGVNPQNIGIITPYNSQKYRLIDKFDEKKYEDLRIESVDGFQGMEKDYIIISTVRSNVSGNIGFLTSAKRLNVALTRAKYGTIILGNAECLSRKASIWKDLITFYYSQDLIVKGPFTNLEKVQKNEIFVREIKNEEEEKKKEEKEKEEKKKEKKKKDDKEGEKEEEGEEKEEGEKEEKEEEEEKEEKEEKHRSFKKEIAIDYFKEMEIIKNYNPPKMKQLNLKNNIKGYDDDDDEDEEKEDDENEDNENEDNENEDIQPAPAPLENNINLEDRNSKNKKKNKKNKISSDEEEDKREDEKEEKNKENKKNRNKKNKKNLDEEEDKKEDEKEEKNIGNKKNRNKKNKKNVNEEEDKKEDEKEENNDGNKKTKNKKSKKNADEEEDKKDEKGKNKNKRNKELNSKEEDKKDENKKNKNSNYNAQESNKNNKKTKKNKKGNNSSSDEEDKNKKDKKKKKK